MHFFLVGLLGHLLTLPPAHAPPMPQSAPHQHSPGQTLLMFSFGQFRGGGRPWAPCSGYSSLINYTVGWSRTFFWILDYCKCPSEFGISLDLLSFHYFNFFIWFIFCSQFCSFFSPLNPWEHRTCSQFWMREVFFPTLVNVDFISLLST